VLLIAPHYSDGSPASDLRSAWGFLALLSIRVMCCCAAVLLGTRRGACTAGGLVLVMCTGRHWTDWKALCHAGLVLM
jgi:hypothetical protein